MIEVNLDALVGPTHHFSGLGIGNTASKRHRHQPSSPKKAALQGLNKAFLVARQGVPQFLLPPLPRPEMAMLEQYGFCGSPQEQLRCALQEDPSLLSAVFSSSFMWAANMATVTFADDSRDGKCHLTVANLISSLHRSSEGPARLEQLRQLFKSLGNRVAVHPPLPPSVPLRDEGAANHMRLTVGGSNTGFNLFVHGDDPRVEIISSRLFPRQTLSASQMVARLHQLDTSHTFFLRQHPEAISAGAFHNDVVATSHCQLLLHHELAFEPAEEEKLRAIENSFERTFDQPLQRVVVKETALSLKDAVSSYLFNSQIISPNPLGNTDTGSGMMMICPQQCYEIDAARNLIEQWLADPDIPIEKVEYVELRESMAGGGGPACLRLRIPLQPEELSGLDPGYRTDQSLFDDLGEIIDRYYPEQLQSNDLAEWDFVVSAKRATQAITQRLGQLH